MVPSRVSEKPTRMPAKISGTAAGNRTTRRVSAVRRLWARAVLMKIGLILRSALMVKIAIGTMPWSAPNAILAGMHEGIKRDLGNGVERDQHGLHDLAGKAVE